MSDLEFIRLLKSYIQFERIMIYPAERSDYKQILKELNELELDFKKGIFKQ